jgi:iron complex transport system substrate-binding protein
VFVAGHWVPEMIRRAGGIDVIAQPGQHSRTLDLTAIEAADPEIVIIAPCGYALERATAEAHMVLDRDEWQWMRRRTVWAVDANAFVSRPGPRVVDGIETFAQIFHPSLFPAPGSSAAVRVT